MPRLSLEKKKVLIGLIKKNYSLKKIYDLLSIKKTTAYYYMLKIKGKSIQSVSLNERDNECIGEIVGIFAGDGNYYYDKNKWERRIRFYFNITERKLVNHYIKSLKKVFGKSPRVYETKNMLIIEYKSKIVSQFFQEKLFWTDKKIYSVCLRDKTSLKDLSFNKGFIRGLIDSDGYVRKGRREIYFGSVSRSLASDFCQGLKTMGILYKEYTQKREGFSDFYKVRISNDEVDKCIKLVKPVKAYL